MKELKKTPELRFPEFSESWEVKKFNEAVKRGKEKYNPERDVEAYQCIELESISQNSGTLIQTFNSKELKSIKNRFKKDDVLYGKLRPYLKKFYQAKFDGVCSSEIWVLKGRNSNNGFIYYLIQTNKFDYEVNLTTGSKMPRAEWDYISNVRFSLPSLPEQTKIANFLTTVDERIKLLTHQKEKLEQYKKGVMQQLFSQQIRFKDDDGNDFPEWEEKRFGELYCFASTNSLSREKLNYENGNVKNIHYGDIHTKFNSHFFIKEELVPYINSDVELNKTKNDSYLEEGDLVIADASEDYADIGKTIEICELNGERVLAGLHTFLAKRKISNLVIGFGGHLMRNWSMRLEIMRIAQGTKVLSISTKRLADIPIKLPTVPEQQKIASFLSSIDKKIDLVSSQIEQTKSWKKGLLQKMFV